MKRTMLESLAVLVGWSVAVTSSVSAAGSVEEPVRPGVAPVSQPAPSSIRQPNCLAKLPSLAAPPLVPAIIVTFGEPVMVCVPLFVRISA